MLQAVRASVVALALALALPAVAATLSSTPADVDAQLKAAQPGDVVQFVGAFDHVFLRDRTFSPPVVLDFSQASLVNLRLMNVQGVTADGGGRAQVSAQAGDWLGGIYAVGCAHVKVIGFAVAANNGPGVSFRNCQDVDLEASRIDNARVAVPLLNVDGFRIVDVTLTGFSADGVDAFSSWRGYVGEIACAGARDIGDGAHRDCVQVANTIAGARPAGDIEIAFNQAHGDSDGFTAFIGPPNDPGFDRLSIHDNFAAVSVAHGVSAYSCRDCVARRNHVMTLPGAPNRTSINLVGGSVAHCGNVAESGGAPAKPAWADAACAP